MQRWVGGRVRNVASRGKLVGNWMGINLVGQVGVSWCWRRRQGRERVNSLVGKCVWDAVFKCWGAGRWRRRRWGEVWTRLCQFSMN